MLYRPIHRESVAEIELVASRMRLTLMEVLGHERGAEMYDMNWLINRVRWHLDPVNTKAEIFLAEAADQTIVGHTIVRVDLSPNPPEYPYQQEHPRYGIFSTTYVVPELRRAGLANQLLEAGESWIRSQGQCYAVTDTAADNGKLQLLFEKRGYGIIVREGEMVRLGKSLTKE
jgi:GNAT superfamily N-acetyltransferase